MKFGKKLQDQLESTSPEWRPNFLSYKQLKKRLKVLGAPVAFIDAATLEINAFSASVPTDTLAPRIEGFVDGEDLDRRWRRASPDVAEESKKRKLSMLVDVTEDYSETSKPNATPVVSDVGHRSVEDNNFLRLVRIELHKFNAFFLEKEDELFIRLDVLQERAQEFKEKCAEKGGVLDRWAYQELIQVCGLIVTLHGEMVLLLNYSSLNFIGLVKILKKHDKHTGANLRRSVLASVLHQPFFRTTNLKQLIERCLECEASLRSIHPFPVNENIVLSLDAPPNEAVDFGPIPRQVEAALRTIQDMGRD